MWIIRAKEEWLPLYKGLREYPNFFPSKRIDRNPEK